MRALTTLVNGLFRDTESSYRPAEVLERLGPDTVVELEKRSPGIYEVRTVGGTELVFELYSRRRRPRDHGG